jgi:hypothetical protein
MKYLSILILVLLFAGCDIFDVRDAEKPESPRDNYQLAATPDILISNFINSLKDKNVENYLSCFADSSFSEKDFNFSPSAGAGSQFPIFLQNWTKQDERQYFNRMKAVVNEELPVTLILNNNLINHLGDSAVFTASYSLTVPHNDNDIPVSFSGDMKLSISTDSRNVWVIYFWQDIKNSNSPSWSELKGLFH